MRLRGAYAIGICVITFDSRVRPHTAASSRFGEPSTARSHSREKRHHLRLELARACGTRTSLGCNRAWPLSSQGSDRSYGPDPRRYCLSHKLVPEPCAVGLDEPRRRRWKMDPQKLFAGPGDLGEKLSPRPRGLRRIPVEDRRPIGLATLQGVVHEVADHDRVLSARADIDAAMVGRMAGRRHEPKRIVELIAVVDEQRLAGFDDRLAIVAKHIAAAAGAGFAALGRFLPGGIFAFVENIFGFRKCRHPASLAQHRV